ncbi:MAG: MATE family efflux transporter [Lewinellaceae bacterium]|nr:MATE family efflux transporter [Lewinellaceae bacterium]
MQKMIALLREALSGEEKSYVTGSINHALILLSIPMILEMVMEALFAVVDAFFVARVSVAAVATVGLTESVITLLYALAIGLSMGATAMVARRVGENNRLAAAVAARQAILIGLCISFVLGIFGVWLADDVLRLMGADAEVLATGTTYARIAFGSNVVIMLLFLLNGVFRGAGDATLAMRSLWLANGINILLDPILIFGLGPFPEMGVTGAALATTIGRGTGVAYQLYLLWGGNSIVPLRKAPAQIDWPVIRRLLKVSVTGAGQFLIGSASWVFLMRIMARFGSEALAGYTIAIRLVIFTILPSWGLANAAATLVGQNLGAGQPERAEQSVWQAGKYNMYFLVGVSILFFVFAPGLIQLFDTTPGVVDTGVLCLRIVCLGYVFYAYGMIIAQAFNGAGDTRTPTLINLVCFWAIEIPLAYGLAVGLEWEVAGICTAIAVSETILAVLAIMIFRRGHWKTVKI